jgi:hypothetical protein
MLGVFLDRVVSPEVLRDILVITLQGLLHIWEAAGRRYLGVRAPLMRGPA